MDKKNKSLNKNEKKCSRNKCKGNKLKILCLVVGIVIAIICIPKFCADISNRASNKMDYTWEEYTQLSVEEQDEFKNNFETEEEFYAWLSSEAEDVTLLPWEIEGRVPTDYDWEEYESLSSNEKEAFKNYFQSDEAFSLWKENAKNTEKPWENGGKTPSEYSWEEFEKLNSEQQEAFFASFETSDELERWLEKVDAP